MIGKVCRLTPKALENPMYKATAGQIAETGRLITRLVYKGTKSPLERNADAKAFYNFANSDGGGNIMKKCFFHNDYKFTRKGRKWLEQKLDLFDLNGNASLRDYMSATMEALREIIKR